MRPLLALHCALASGAAWNGLFAALPGVDGIAPDLPGHGRAPEAEGAMMDAALARALEAAPAGPVDIVGHSYGAVVALRLLAEHPGRVRSLTLVEPVLFAAHPEARDWDAQAMAPFREALAAGDRAAAARYFHGLWGAGSWDGLPEGARRYIRDRIHLIAESAGALVGDCHRILPGLPPEAAPLLVTRRSPPRPVARIADGLAERMPRLRRAETGDGHMIPMTHPEALAGLLREQLDLST
ncbi:alpha/beta fold hydrolase [Jannaschia formosa]|uniref:alpha/beta fold hydrolase n=1 Tax=Jannaschia formosa TaxID=2259592 RepID=UPI00142F69E8|nr:alpha/beta hydrolase [Jannaschia formosa]